MNTKKIIGYMTAACLAIQGSSCLKKDLNNAEGQLSEFVSVYTVRNLYKGTDISYTDADANYRMGAVVTSDASGNNLPEGWVVMQNSGRGATRGIVVKLTAAEAAAYVPGDSVEVDLRGAVLSAENGMLVIRQLTASSIVKKQTDITVLPTSISLRQYAEQPANFESVLLQINADVVPLPQSGDIYEGDKLLSDGSTDSEIFLHTESSAVFSGEAFPDRALFTGIAMPLKVDGQTLQLQVRARTIDDVFSVPKYEVSTYTGNGAGNTLDNIPNALLRGPEGLVFDHEGNLIIADRSNNQIKKITPAGTVSVLAGSGTAGFADGAAATARFYTPWKVGVDADGGILVADRGNQLIRKIKDGVVSTIAGTQGVAGLANGPAATALFNTPDDVAADKYGNVYVVDETNNCIRKITPDGFVSTYAGGNGAGHLDGPASEAKFRAPAGLAVDSSGNVYVADRNNHVIRKIDPVGSVSTIIGKPGVSGGADGPAAAATLYQPYGIFIDNAGNIYIPELMNHKIRQMTPGGLVFTVAGNGTAGTTNGSGSTVQFNQPTDVAVDASGVIYVADYGNHRIRKIVKL